MPTTSTQTNLGTGVTVALISAATFGSSGPMAKSLIEAGWTPGAAVLVRLGGAASILIVAAAIVLRGRLRLSIASVRTVVLYGVIAMAGTQLAYFNAVRTLDVGVALLLEFLAPVMLLAWTSVRTRTLPGPTTSLGAALAVIGLVLVLELSTGGRVDPVGVAWGLLAAVCLSTFFVLSAHQADDLPPLVMAAGGTAVGTLVIATAGVIGIVPLAFADADVTLAGAQLGWLIPAVWLVAVSTVLAYMTGISAVRRLGTRVASFVALTEVLFAVLVAWVLLAELPGLMQLAGGVCIVTGIVIVQRSEYVAPPSEPPPAIEAVHPV